MSQIVQALTIETWACNASMGQHCLPRFESCLLGAFGSISLIEGTELTFVFAKLILLDNTTSHAIRLRCTLILFLEVGSWRCWYDWKLGLLVIAYTINLWLPTRSRSTDTIIPIKRLTCRLLLSHWLDLTSHHAVGLPWLFDLKVYIRATSRMVAYRCLVHL